MEAHDLRSAGRLRWGIIGTQPFLAEHCFPDISRGDYSILTAVASRSESRAKALATSLGVDKAYSSYDDLLGDPSIDLVYLTLPTYLHAEWTVRAIAAGKHVLCEKTLTPNGRDTRRLLESVCGRGPFLFEGYMWKHHPQWTEVERLIATGTIGDVLYLHCHYSYYDRDARRARNSAIHNGGAFSMVGCYPISIALSIFRNQQLKRVSADFDVDPDFGVDRLATGSMIFDRGRADFTVASQMADFENVVIHGSSGSITLNAPITPRSDERVSIVVTNELGKETFLLPAASQFAIQADAVSRAVMSGRPPSLEHGLKVIDIMDVMRSSAK